MRTRRRFASICQRSPDQLEPVLLSFFPTGLRSGEQMFEWLRVYLAKRTILPWMPPFDARWWAAEASESGKLAVDHDPDRTVIQQASGFGPIARRWNAPVSLKR